MYRSLRLFAMANVPFATQRLGFEIIYHRESELRLRQQSSTRFRNPLVFQGTLVYNVLLRVHMSYRLLVSLRLLICL